MSSRSAALRPLLGYRVGVTAARRREEQVALLERRGAQVVSAPVVHTTPLPDDADLAAATRRCVDDPPDYVVATTGIGFRGWCEAADGWGMGESLMAALATSTLLARGSKTVGAIRAAGLREAWSAPSETLEDLLDHLVDRGVRGQRVVLQEYGEALDEVVATLHRAGAEVDVVSVYRCETATDRHPVERLLELVLRREVEALTFTSATASTAFLDLVEGSERGADLMHALRADVTVACVGPVTAAPFATYGIATVQPERARLGAMVRELSIRLPQRRRDPMLTLAGRRVELQGAAVLVDGEAVALSRTPRAVLEALTERPGEVWSRRRLLERLPSGTAGSEHAVEMAVARIRAVLGSAAVETVVKRGYRVGATEPPG